LIGKTLNHYRITAQLGKGGMGEVYAAEDTKLDRKVALKILPAEMATDAERRMRFEREAKAVAALNHPNIVTIHSVEESEGTHFITMELVEGKPLSALIPKSGMTLNDILGRAIDLSEAVSAAHKQGITHRDLKPDNVMVGQDGRLKVLDFGLAKLREESQTKAPDTRLPTETPTEAGRVMGTVAYMSPEQAEGKPVDARSDVFSMGILLYEMATGRRPFEGDTHVSTMSAILRDNPTSVTELNEALPRHLGRIIKRCMAKEPDRRYQTAVDLRNELVGLREELASGEIEPGIAAAASARRPRPRWLPAAMAVLALVAVAVGYGLNHLGRSGSSPETGSASSRSMKMTRLTSTGKSEEAAISRDGKYVVHVLHDAGNQSLWITLVNTVSSVELVAPTDATITDPTFSPDGVHVYYLRREKGAGVWALFNVPVLGGPSRKVMEPISGRVSFSPDGTRFVFERQDPEGGISNILTANVDGSEAREIATCVFPDLCDDPVWSPDGQVIAVPVTTIAGGVQGNIREVPVAGGELKPIGSETWSWVSETAWLPDGSGLVLGAQERGSFSDQLWEISYPAGSVRRITNDLYSYEGVGLTADGTALVTEQNENKYTVWVGFPDHSKEPRQITTGTRRDDDNGISSAPDGKIYFGSTAGGNLDIWLADPEGGSPRQLTDGTNSDFGPSACGDGRYVVFASDRGGSWNIWRMDAEGSHPIQLTDGELEAFPACSPDGQWVAYLGTFENDFSLFKISIDGGDPHRVSKIGANPPRPAISPDGNEIAFRSWDEELKRLRTVIVSAEGGEPSRDVDIPSGIYQWSPDGEALTYVQTDGGVGNIWSQPLDGGSATQLTHFDSDLIGDFAWSGDGTGLVLTRGVVIRDVVLLENFR
jgi:serine/threonine protein kinase